jgi:hypothetical protein
MQLPWVKGWLSGKPHFIIGGADNPYLLRWYILPRNRFFNVYLHKFMRDDEDRALHDHPWWFASLMLRGSYDEVQDYCVEHRHAPSIAYRCATHRHRVVLMRDEQDKPIPCWTLILTGRVSRVWGFWCAGKGFVPWMQFVAPHDVGAVGRGCD